MKNRFIFRFFLVCMAVSVLLAGVGAAGSEPFTDVRAGDWFYSGVQYAYSNGLMNGVGGSAFNPQGSTTRGMIVTILHRMEGKPEVDRACPFADVAAGSYYEEAVIWAADNGIVTGYSEEQFGPLDNITREQMATILYRYALHKGYDTEDAADISVYSDYSRIGSYALEALAWANAAELINGLSADTLSPKGQATRAQTAVILARFCQQYVGERNDPDGEKPQDGESGEEAPVYLGVQADQADPNAKNLFLLSAAASGDGKTVDVTLTLTGDVTLCGFDLQLLYDSERFTLQELDTGYDLAVFASAGEGCICFNYAAATNITKSKTVLSATFNVVGELDENAVFSMAPVEVIMTDADKDYAVVEAEYTLTYCPVVS